MHRIIWSPTAIVHFSSWVRTIARDSPKRAEKERQKILKAVERLKRFPQSGRMVPEFGTLRLREIIHKPIRIIYRVESKEVRILTLHHSRRQLDLDLFP